jgi:E3 ubiquitin-protein ligase HECTD4
MKTRTSRRSFLSAAAAGECTQLLISLIHTLVATEESLVAAAPKPWTIAIDAVLDQVLSTLPITVEWISGTAGQPSASHLEDASLALAAVSVLGGFREEVHVGAHVIVARRNLQPAIGIVDTLDASQNEAVVEFEDGVLERVPLSCVQSQFDDPPESLSTMVPQGFQTALEALLHKGNGQPVGVQAVPVAELSYEAIAAGHRALAELRTRACMVLALRLQHPQLAQEFLDTSENALNIVVRLAREAQRVAGDAMPVLEAACARYRAAFLEKERPKIVSISSGGKDAAAAMTWNVLQELPRLQGVLFNRGLCDVNLVVQRRSDRPASRPTSRRALTILFGTSSIPANADVFYFELQIVRLGVDASPAFGVGLSPLPDKASQAASEFQWPPGSVLLYSDNTVCYQRSSDSQERQDHAIELKSGDTIGCGWVAESSKIVFTHNGQLLDLSVQGVPRASRPVLYLANAGSEIKTNFGGAQPFRFDPAGLKAVAQEAVQALHEESDGPSELFSMSLLADSDDEDSFFAPPAISKHTVDYRTIELGSVTSGCLEDSSYSLVASGSTMTGNLLVRLQYDSLVV